MMVGHEVSAAGEAVFLRDFDGNRLEAVCHPGLSRQLAAQNPSKCCAKGSKRLMSNYLAQN
jgi:hypothetical protein